METSQDQREKYNRQIFTNGGDSVDFESDPDVTFVDQAQDRDSLMI